MFHRVNLKTNIMNTPERKGVEEFFFWEIIIKMSYVQCYA